MTQMAKAAEEPAKTAEEPAVEAKEKTLEDEKAPEESEDEGSEAETTEEEEETYVPPAKKRKLGGKIRSLARINYDAGEIIPRRGDSRRGVWCDGAASGGGDALWPCGAAVALLPDGAATPAARLCNSAILAGAHSCGRGVWRGVCDARGLRGFGACCGGRR